MVLADFLSHSRGGGRGWVPALSWVVGVCSVVWLVASIQGRSGAFQGVVSRKAGFCSR